MARMIPVDGTLHTESKAEERVYQLLRRSLPDDFTVIHSLPWLSVGVKAIDSKYPPTGEIDFLVIHEDLGVLALEIKGGRRRVQGSVFVQVSNGQKDDVVRQTRKNVHGLAKWLGVHPSLRLRIGYGLVFTDSDFKDVLIPGLVDTSIDPPQTIIVDRRGLADLGDRVRAIMVYWKATLGNGALGRARKAHLLEVLCPEFNGTPSWASRIEYDRRFWLRLTEEQASVVDMAATQNRIVVTGWPGTGKTVIAVELARRMIAAGKRVLALTFNALLAEHLKREINTEARGQVATWHGFCSGIARQLPGKRVTSPEWLEQGGMDTLREAAQLGLVPTFDVLILDEAQTFRLEWGEWLAAHFSGQQMVAFCDETQVFGFEKDRISTAELCRILDAGKEFLLTIPLRSPRAVLHRLQSVRSPGHQVFSPREMDKEELCEVLVVDMDVALDQTLQRLKAQGVSPSDIVVLSKYVPVRTQEEGSERYEIVSRFRGMEASCVVVVWAESMDDVELFSAYSRATSICIALYEIERLVSRTSPGRFFQQLLTNPENAQRAERARVEGLTSHVVSQFVESESLNLKSVRLSWSPSWSGWLIESAEDSEASDLWSDYLLCHHDWPVYSWAPDSRREVSGSEPIADALKDVPGMWPMATQRCEVCERVTPHTRQQSVEYRCYLCERAPVSDDSPSEAIRTTLRRFDAVISSPDPTQLPKEEIRQLPLSLAALGSRIFVRTRGSRHHAKMNDLPGGIVYRATMAFAYSRISALPPGAAITRDKLVQICSRYAWPPGVTEEQFRQKVGQSLGKCFADGLIRKIDKGVYLTIPWDDPPSEKVGLQK